MTAVRPTSVAGSFYPDSPGELETLFDRLEEQAEAVIPALSTPPGPPIGVIVPHAGYIYSGAVAMAGFKTAARQRPATARVVLISPSHRIGFSGVAVGEYEQLATPAGALPVDTEAQNRLLAAADGRLLHRGTRALEHEHALEVELPIIKRVFGDIPVLPLVSGRICPDEARQLAGELSRLDDGKTLFAISSDFTHYGRDFDYVPFTADVAAQLKQLDGKAAELICRADLAGFGRFLAETGATICGAAAIKLMLALLESSGGGSGTVVANTSSGDLTGDFSHCVDYYSILLYKK